MKKLMFHTITPQINRRSFVAGIVASSATRLLAAAPPQNEIPNVWGEGQLLCFSALDGATDYAAGLVARSTTLPLGLKVVRPGKATIRCGEAVTGAVQITSDTFLVETESGLVRGALVDAHHILLEGAFTIADADDTLQTATKGSKTLLGVRKYFDIRLLELNLTSIVAKRHEWILSQRLPAGLPVARQRTLRKALSVMKGQVNSPEGLIHHRWTTPDRWPHRDLWLWDSVFHALGWRHLDKQVARDALQAVFDGQHSDGCIPHQLSPVKSSNVTQPPLLAFGVQQVMGSAPDVSWLRDCYPKLARYLAWDFKQRMGEDELAHWFIDTDPLSRSGESGMDNSPRFDGATRLYAVDFNAFLSLECAVMAEFARTLKLDEDAATWQRKHEVLNRTINALLWNEEAGFYFDYDPATKKQTGVFAVSGFLPLLCGAVDAHNVDRLLQQMRDPRKFGTPVPLPSAVVRVETANRGDMWRGPMWVNTNWLVALGLERTGRPKEAARLRESTMAEIERRYLERGTLFEFYDENGVLPPDKLPRKGRNDPSSPMHQAIHDYGWTCTLYADLVYSTTRR